MNSVVMGPDDLDLIYVELAVDVAEQVVATFAAVARRD